MGFYDFYELINVDPDHENRKQIGVCVDASVHLNDTAYIDLSIYEDEDDEDCPIAGSVVMTPMQCKRLIDVLQKALEQLDVCCPGCGSTKQGVHSYMCELNPENQKAGS